MCVCVLSGQTWPVHDATALEETEITLAVQVGGRLRGEIRIPSSLADNPEVCLLGLVGCCCWCCTGGKCSKQPVP